MKKCLILLASTALLFALLTGCNSENNNPPSVETTTAPAAVQTTEPSTESVKEPETQTTTEEKTERATEKIKEEKPVDNKIQNDNLPKSTAKATDTKINISKDEAKKAVLEHAGLSENEIKFYKSELDRERKGLVYEIEFDAGKYEYEYEVDADSGKIIKAEKEIND